MSTHKHIDKICLVAALLSLILTGLFANGEALGIQQAANVMGYENRLFDTSQVHTIEIVMDDWDSFIETCENEEYAACSVVIDGEAYKNVGIRAKGNTSLSTVSSMESDRYSFKIEFDQYDSTKSYHGLDKLSLNNVIQDNTYMKDYLTYQMMGQFGTAAPLCSYVYISVNGEDWGLYLAVEGIEDSFLQRNYGSDYGQLYKPDAMNFGGGRGNGKEFNLEEFMTGQNEGFSGDKSGMARPEMPVMPEGGTPSAISGAEAETSSNFDSEAMSAEQDNNLPSAESMSDRPNRPSMRGGGGGPGEGMGSSDVKLQYIDDDPDSYSNIFSSAKTEITEADKTRLIQSLKSLSEGENIASVVNVEAVIRYFVVHNFVCNGDSYTGNMIHNYYMYEENGQLSMLPWDYNLAYGTFQASNATETVNAPIDTPVSGGTGEDRPMVNWIFTNEEYTQLYHRYFAEFLENTDFGAMIDETAALIAPYVEKDPSKFCTYEAFESGVAALREFCLLREESVQGQLKGIIPATAQGQSEDSSTLIDASHISLSDMGTMNMGGRGEWGGPGEAFPLNGGFPAPGNGNMPVPGSQPETKDEATTEPQMQEEPFTQQTSDNVPGMPGNMASPGEGGSDMFPQIAGTSSAKPGDVAELQGKSEWTLMSVSVLTLLSGLLFAFKFKR